MPTKLPGIRTAIIALGLGVAIAAPAIGATHIGCPSPAADTWEDVKLPDSANPTLMAIYYIYNDEAGGADGFGLYKESNHADSFQPKTGTCVAEDGTGHSFVHDYPGDVRIL